MPIRRDRFSRLGVGSASCRPRHGGRTLFGMAAFGEWIDDGDPAAPHAALKM